VEIVAQPTARRRVQLAILLSGVIVFPATSSSITPRLDANLRNPMAVLRANKVVLPVRCSTATPSYPKGRLCSLGIGVVPKSRRHNRILLPSRKVGLIVTAFASFGTGFGDSSMAMSMARLAARRSCQRDTPRPGTRLHPLPDECSCRSADRDYRDVTCLLMDGARRELLP